MATKKAEVKQPEPAAPKAQPSEFASLLKKQEADATAKAAKMRETRALGKEGLAKVVRQNLAQLPKVGPKAQAQIHANNMLLMGLNPKYDRQKYDAMIAELGA